MKPLTLKQFVWEFLGSLAVAVVALAIAVPDARGQVPIYTHPPLVNQSNVTITGGSITGTNVPYTVAQSAIPFIAASSGTMGNNCAISGLTALAVTYSNGAYIWLPAGAVAAGVPAAGTWYWFVASSTTAGTCFNNIYTSGVPTIPASPTAFATTGPGAFAGDQGTISGPTITIPAGAMGANGFLDLEAVYAATNNANTKAAIASFGAALPMNQALSIDVTQMTFTRISNEGSQTVNKSFSTGLAASGVVRQTALTRSAVDTSAAVTTIFKLSHTTAATDNTVLENWRIRVAYSP
jgi:hypothetical protein